MAEAFKFELVSPARLLVSEEVDQVVVPGSEGYFSVLKGHAPFMSTVRPGVLEVTTHTGKQSKFLVIGGFADVESEVGRGSTFHVYFPAVDSVASVSVENEQPVKGGSSGKILVVDDEELIRDYNQAFLEASGYQVTVASNADEAIKLLESESFDLLYSDNKMPGKSGYELIGIVVQRWPGLKCVLASGHLEDPIQRTVIGWGGVILKKPYHMNEALKAVAGLLASKAQAKEAQ